MKEEALDILLTWSRPPVLDRVERRYRLLENRDVTLLPNLINSRLSGLLSEDSNTNDLKLKLLQHYNISIDSSILQQRLADDSRPTSERIEIFNVLVQQANARKSAFQTAYQSNDVTLRMRALEMQAQQDEQAAIRKIDNILKESTNLLERQHAIAQLGTTQHQQGKRLMSSLLTKLSNGSIDYAEQLDVFLAAAENPDFQDVLDGIRKKAGDGTDTPYQFSLYGGNAITGESIFVTHPAAQCIRCHAVKEGNGSNVGPNLQGIGSKFDRGYLLEALVAPSKTMAEGFDNGNGISAMPPMGQLLTPSELRDVIAYLATL
jgi:cytochrome c553